MAFSIPPANAQEINPSSVKKTKVSAKVSAKDNESLVAPKLRDAQPISAKPIVAKKKNTAKISPKPLDETHTPALVKEPKPKTKSPISSGKSKPKLQTKTQTKPVPSKPKPTSSPQTHTSQSVIAPMMAEPLSSDSSTAAPLQDQTNSINASATEAFESTIDQNQPPAQQANANEIPSLTAPLLSEDIRLYKEAFSFVASGDFEAASERELLINNQNLIGYIEFNKLFHRDYEASYEELTQWIKLYGHLPNAMRVWNLAKRKKPEGAQDPMLPILNSTSPIQDDGVQSSTKPIGSEARLTPKSARSAYNDGHLEQAIKLGVKIGDRWVAGLAAYRLKRFSEAQAHFEFIIHDPSMDASGQSGGAYWAGRAAIAQNKPDAAKLYFKYAASYPFTFYGIVAEQRLGVESAVRLAKRGLPPTYRASQRDGILANATHDYSVLKTNSNTQSTALRITQLMQVGRNSDAKLELQTALARSTDKTIREAWLGFASANNLTPSSIKPKDKAFDIESYDMPELVANGGFSIDKALIYAIARRESRFNASAHSFSGAYGLMQLMPATAANVMRDQSFVQNPDQLLDAKINLRVGQDYLAALLANNIVKGDLMRAIAAYNAGPRPVLDAVKSLGENADSLLIMESIPVAQTRAYVEDVVASYWIYQKLLNEPSATLAQAASDAKIIRLSDDNKPAIVKPKK